MKLINLNISIIAPTFKRKYHTLIFSDNVIVFQRNLRFNKANVTIMQTSDKCYRCIFVEWFNGFGRMYEIEEYKTFRSQEHLAVYLEHMSGATELARLRNQFYKI